jgi:hypothetical protein
MTFNLNTHFNGDNSADKITSEVGGITMKQCSIDFLNAVFDPFKAQASARVPDLRKDDTICMRDYVDTYTPANPGVNTSDGFIAIWLYGHNDLSIKQDKNAVQAGWLSNYYGILVFPIDAATQSILVSQGASLINFRNHDTILGLADGQATFTGLVDGLRIFAGGIKCLPTIEMVTSDDTTYLLNIWGGQMQPGELYNILDDDTTAADGNEIKFDEVQTAYDILEPYIHQNSKTSKVPMDKAIAAVRKCYGGLRATQDGANVYETVRNMRNVQEFPNSKGCTARYNPFQREEQLEMNDMRGISMVQNSSYATRNYITNSTNFPFICCKMNTTIAEGEEYPAILYGSVWLEGQLIRPTPIYSDSSPVDQNFNKIRSVACDTVAFPVTVSGHSFKSFVASAGKFANIVLSGLEDLQPYIKTGRRMINAAQQSGRRKRKKNQRKTKSRGLPQRPRRVRRSQRSGLPMGNKTNRPQYVRVKNV